MKRRVIFPRTASADGPVWARMGIAARIWIGFGGILAILGAMAGFGLVSTANVSTLFSDYQGAARSSFSVGQIHRALGEVRLSFDDYSVAPSSENAATTEAAAQGLSEAATVAEMALASDPRAVELARGVSDVALQFREDLDRTVAAQSEFDDLIAGFDAQAEEIRRTLALIIDAGFSTKDLEGTYYASLSLQQAARTRSSLQQYLLTADPQFFDQALQNLEFVRSSFMASMALSFSDSFAGRRETLFSELDGIAGTMTLIDTAFRDLRASQAGLLQLIGPSADEQVKALGTHLDAVQARLQTEARAYIDKTQLALLVFTGASLLIATFFSVLTERSISRPIAGFSTVLRKLADSKYDVRIQGTGHKHALGDMARALKVLRDIAVEAEATRELQRKDAANRIKAAEERELAEREADEERRDKALQQAAVVNALAEALRGLAAGNVDTLIEAPFPDGYEQLRADFNAAVKALREVISGLVDTAGTIEATSSEIAVQSRQLSEQSDAAASTLSQSASAITDLASSVRKAAEAASGARSRVEAAQDSAKHTVTVVSDTTEAMQAIATLSSEISKITDVIEDIAFQTNLLALNAGVEAARAGETGRGFAIVASEVRNLAHRSTESAQQINKLVASSAAAVERGVECVGQSSEVLGRIMAEVSEVESHVSGAARLASQQSARITEIEEAIANLERNTTQNAGAMVEMAKANQGLRDQSCSLTRLVARFSLNEADGSDQKGSRSSAA